MASSCNLGMVGGDEFVVGMWESFERRLDRVWGLGRMW